MRSEVLRVKRMRGNDESVWIEQAPSKAKTAADNAGAAKPAADKTPQVGLESLKAASPCRCCRSISESCTSNLPKSLVSGRC